MCTAWVFWEIDSPLPPWIPSSQRWLLIDNLISKFFPIFPPISSRSRHFYAHYVWKRSKMEQSTGLDFKAEVTSCTSLYRGADKSLARPGRKQANVCVRMAWISFGALPSRAWKNWWHLASPSCWNRSRPWYASELVSLPGRAKDLSAPPVNTVSLLLMCI